MRKMEQSKITTFIKSLGLNEQVASVLFETLGDCKLFFNEFYKHNKFEIDDLLDFREYKISMSLQTEETFIDKCNSIGLKETFEKTFYEKFNDKDIALIEQALKDEVTTLKNLFSQFKDNPNTKILKYVL